ncbi:MAG: hypothetical protein HY908_37945 [Myxococcales bacterium]|nr:hypothetical protein [Myxococcales bacterium]
MTYRDELGAAQARIRALEQELEALRALDAARAEPEQAPDRDAMLEALRERVAHYRDENRRAEARVAELEARLGVAETAEREARHEAEAAAAVVTHLTASDAQAQSAAEQLAGLAEELRQARAEARAATARTTEREPALGAAGARATELEAEVESLRAALERAHAALEEPARRAHLGEEAVRALRERLSYYRDELRRAEARVAELERRAVTPRG